MNRLIGALAAAAVVGMASVSGVQASKATDDLGKLVHGNLGEAAMLQSQLPSLRGHHRATWIWKHMIMDHKNGAMMLAHLDRRMGGRPDMSMPSADSSGGSYHDVLAKTLQGHLDTLQTVQGMYPNSRPREQRALHMLADVVRGHIRMIRSVMGRRRMRGM